MEDLINQRLDAGVPIESIMAELSRSGGNVPRNLIQLYKSMPDVFVPEPVLEYLKWMRAPAEVHPAWEKMLQFADGFHALAKGMATISSLAHIGMNFTGNYASIAQKLGVDIFNPRHHLNTWMVMFSDTLPSLEKELITVGGKRMTIGQLKKQMAEAGIDESPRTLAYLEEALGGDRTTIKAPLGQMLMGSGMGAGAGWVAGSAIAGPLGGAAGGFLGSWVGALGGEIVGKSWKKAVDPMTGERVTRPLSGVSLDLKAGAANVANTEVGKCIDSIKKFTEKGLAKDAIQNVGEKVVGIGAAGVVGSTLGGGATAVSGAIGALAFPSYMKMMSALHQTVEIQARRLLGIAELSRGKSIDEAAFAVQDTMRNYAHLTPLEKQVLRRMFFFYTWDAGNIRFQLRQLVGNPRQASVFKNFMAGIYNGQFTESELNALPEYLRWRAIFRLGGAKIYSISGLPQQAAIELSRGLSTKGGVPIGLFSRGRPDVLMLAEYVMGKESLYYQKGWEELNNVRSLKNAPPLLKWIAGYPSSPSPVPVYKKGRKVGKRMDYRSTKPENLYMMSRLPGYRVIQEYMKLVQDTFIARAFDYGDPTAQATTEERMLAYSIGVKPYYVDFDSQREHMSIRLIKELQRRWDLQNKNFTSQRTFMSKHWDYERGEFMNPGDRVDDQSELEYDPYSDPYQGEE